MRPRRNDSSRPPPPRRTGTRGSTKLGAVPRVVLVDDQALLREGLELVLGMLPGIEVDGSAAGAGEALELVGRERPDVVLMDLRMPGVDGGEATRRIGAVHPDIPVLMLTTYADDASIVAALEAGARGYLTK